MFISRKTSEEVIPLDQRAVLSQSEAVYSFTVEECILQSHGSRHVNCPVHKEIPLAQVYNLFTYT